MTAPYTMDEPNTEQPATECIWCGGYIPAGKYPPVCSPHCQQEVKIAVEFEQWAKEYEAMKRPKRKTRQQKIEEAKQERYRPGLKYKEELNKKEASCPRETVTSLNALSVAIARAK